MVNNNDVLTAAHVVYNPSRGSPVHISVIPGQNGRNTPYGISDAGRWNFYQISFTSGGQLTSGQSAWDLAVIGLRQNTGNSTGWLGIRSNVSGAITRNLIHYPSAYALGFQNLRQIYSYASVGTTNSNYLNISGLGVSSGSSGGGIYQLVNGNRYVTGVVSTASWGAYINTTRFNQINSWINSNNDLVTSNVTQNFNLGTVAGSMATGGTVNYNTNRTDRFAFNVAASQNVTLRLSNMTSDADLYLYNVFGQLLGSSALGGTQTDTVTRSLSDGIYYTEVRQYTNTPNTNSYSLAVNPPSSLAAPRTQLAQMAKAPALNDLLGTARSGLLAAAA